MQYNITYREKDGGWQYIISYKDSSGRWKQKSKQGFEKSRKGKQEAKEAAEAALDELKKNINMIVPIEYKDITFKDFGYKYLNHNKLYKAYWTTRSTQTILAKFSALNGIELSKITTLDIQSIVDDFTKEGLSPNTIKYYIKKLRILFNSALNDYKIVASNPVRGIQVKDRAPSTKKALTEFEVDRLLESFKKSKYYLVLFIAAKTGMRIGEILGLLWSDIDTINYFITVDRQWEMDANGVYSFAELKSKNSYRKIPISRDTCTEICKHKKVIGIDNRIFPFADKATVISSINKSLKRKGFDISIHELRHTFASKIIGHGMDYKTAAFILGHDVQQTIKTYSHVNNDMLIKAKNLIENIF